MDCVLAAPGVAQCCCRQIGQPERVIKFAHHEQAAVGTELRAAKFQPYARVEINPIWPQRTHTLWVIHEKHSQMAANTMIYIRNIIVRTAKSARYLGNAGVFLRAPPGWRRAITLPMSLAGVWIVIGAETGLPLPENAGDWLALLGGALFAAGAARVQVAKIDGIFPMLFAFFVFGGAFAVAQSILLADVLGPAPPVETWIKLLPWFLLLCLGFFLPTNILITWAPTQLGAGLFSILILAELIFGTVSAAIWAAEPFGWREVLGSTLILGAGVIEVALSSRQATAQAP